jgi:hypothetical protein
VRFIAIKRKLGWNLNPAKRNYSCYTCRHTFAHRMLSGYCNGGAGCSIETLAELIGDTPKTAGPARILGNLGWRGKSIFGKQKLRETTSLGRR